MSYDEIDQTAAAGPAFFEKNLVGHTLLIWAIGYIDHAPTLVTEPGKKADVIVVDIVDLDQMDPEDGGRGYLARKTWWRGGRIIRDLKARIGNPRPILYQLTKEVGPKKPYELTSMSNNPGYVALAQDWEARHPGHTPSVNQMTPTAAPVQSGPPQNLEEARAAAPTQLPPPVAPVATAASTKLPPPPAPVAPVAAGGTLGRLHAMAAEHQSSDSAPSDIPF